jgi:hypothetical protein
MVEVPLSLGERIGNGYVLADPTRLIANAIQARQLIADAPPSTAAIERPRHSENRRQKFWFRADNFAEWFPARA